MQRKTDGSQARRCHSSTRSSSSRSRWKLRAAAARAAVGRESNAYPPGPSPPPRSPPRVHIGQGSGRRAPRLPHGLRARPPRRRSRSTMTWSGVAATSTRFVDTWTRSPSARPSAWTPGRPPDDSRTARAAACASSSDATQLEVERDERRPHADEHGARTAGRGWTDRAEAPARRRRSAVRARRARRAGRTQDAAPRRSRRRGRQAARGRHPHAARPPAPRRLRAARRRPSVARPAPHRPTPTRGCAPVWSRRSIRLRASSIPATSPSSSARSSPTSVTTER